MRIALNKTKGTQDPRPQDPILSPVQIFNKCSNVQIFKCSNVQMFKCSCVNFPLAGRPHRSRRLSRLAARGQRCTRRLTRIACNVLLPVANKSCSHLARPLHDACTLLPSCVANGQRNLAPDTTKSIPACQSPLPHGTLALPYDMGHTTRRHPKQMCNKAMHSSAPTAPPPGASCLLSPVADAVLAKCTSSPAADADIVSTICLCNVSLDCGLVKSARGR